MSNFYHLFGKFFKIMPYYSFYFSNSPSQLDQKSNGNKWSGPPIESFVPPCLKKLRFIGQLALGCSSHSYSGKAFRKS